MKQGVLWVAAISIACLGLQGCVNREAQKQAKETAEIINDPVKDVKVVPIRSETMVDLLEFNGDVATDSDVTVGAQMAGKLTAVYVSDGQLVQAGQVIAKVDDSLLRKQEQQLVAQIQGAAAQVAQAQKNQRLAPARSTAGVRQAEAQLRSARVQLEKALAGARKEERSQAENSLAAAKSNLETQQKELDRVRRLVKEGALAENRLDQQLNAVQQATSQYKNALEAVALTKSAIRPEDIEAAREGVRSAEQAVASAKANKSLDSLLTDQVTAAKAQLSSVQASLATLRTQIGDTLVIAPRSGIVVGRPLQPGVVVAPGVGVVRLVSSEGVYFDGRVPSEKLEQVKIGATVTVKIDSLPGREFAGTVQSINPVADSIARLFKIRVRISGGVGDLKPGMFAKGSMVLKTIPNAIMVPTSAIQSRDGKRYVMLATGGKARRQFVQVVSVKDDRSQIIGVGAGDKLIVSGQVDLPEGVAIRIEGAREEGNEQPASPRAEAGI